MSTKMSNDLNVSRPTSRVSRPPGGGSTISFGAPEPAPAHHPTPTRLADVVKEPVIEKVVAKSIQGKVGIVVGGSVATDALSNAIAKALVVEGIKGSIITVVNDVQILPYAAQNMARNVDVVVAAAVLTNDPTGMVSNSISAALLQVGVTGRVPIIPGLVVSGSLLEAKAVLATVSEGWAKSAASVLSMKNDSSLDAVPAPEPVIEQKPVYTPALVDVPSLLTVLRESLKAHGASGICGIGRKFRIADDNNNKLIELSEFTKVIKEHALEWSAAQIKAVFDFFDKDKSGNISYDEFLHGLRGELNDRRKQLVLMAFEILDSDKSGVIELNDIQAKYNADKHPDVITHKRTKDQVLREFLDTFDSDNKDGKVTPQEFCDYYSNVSASIDDDDYFELMIRNAWHISGGEGWCANSSCRRVLVIHKDGRQTVEEIKNDLGIKPDDKEAMIANLVKQGINDIASIELAGGTKHAAKDGAKDSNGAAAAPAAAAGVAPHDRATAAAALKTNPLNEQIRPATAPSSFNPRRQPGGASSIVIG